MIMSGMRGRFPALRRDLRSLFRDGKRLVTLVGLGGYR